VVAIVLAAIAIVPMVWQPALRSVGWALVAAEPIGAADAIVVALSSGGAGALEAADLVQDGIAKRVAVFVDPPGGDDFEFIRRGLPYDDWGATQSRQLRSLGVTDIVQIPKVVAGVEGQGDVLPQWCEQNGLRSVVFVTDRGHSRRMQRVLNRIMNGHPIRLTVHPARYSDFDPDRWWQTRGGVRTLVIELQKLVLDVVLHPLSP
jgi:hypothetical protein